MHGFTAYILCTSPRSGSTLLCRMLEATGRCGVPDSHFHEPSVTAWLADHGLPVDGYASPQDALVAAVRAARAAGTGGSAMFGLRLQRHSFDHLIAQLGVLHPDQPSDLARIEAAFGRTLVVHLSRANKLEQAISFLKARQSGLWHIAPDGREIERLSAPRPLVYDRAAIATQIAEFERYERDWAAWFAREGIAPFRIGYEALAQNPQVELGKVLTRLGLSHDLASEVVTPVARLSDEINQAWAERYRAEVGADT